MDTKPNQSHESFHHVKTIPFYLTKDAVSEEGIIKGYASTFGNLDRHKDVMVKGCFQKTLQQTGGKMPVLYNHSKQIGINTKAYEDDKGLYVEAKIFKDSPDIQSAKEAWALIKANLESGTPMGLSVGGLIKEFDVSYVDGRPQWNIKEMELLEYSVTPTPANPKASVLNNKEFSMEVFGKIDRLQEEIKTLNIIKGMQKKYIEALEQTINPRREPK